jgi:hypothetical protein
MRADYCPVPDTPGVCKHEERIEVKVVRTPKECLYDAIVDYGEEMRGSDGERIYNRFVELLKANGHNLVDKAEASSNPETEVGVGKWIPGQTVNIYDISNSHDWVFDRKIKDHDIHESIVYVTRDRTMTVSFDEDSDFGVVMLTRNCKKSCETFKIGQKVFRNEIESSDQWQWMGYGWNDDTIRYISKDGALCVHFIKGCEYSFIDDAESEYEFRVGQHVHIGTIGASNRWCYAGEQNDVVRYVSVNQMMSVAFPRGSDWGTIMLRR